MMATKLPLYRIIRKIKAIKENARFLSTFFFFTLSYMWNKSEILKHLLLIWEVHIFSSLYSSQSHNSSHRLWLSLSKPFQISKQCLKNYNTWKYTFLNLLSDLQMNIYLITTFISLFFFIHKMVLHEYLDCYMDLHKHPANRIAGLVPHKMK